MRINKVIENPIITEKSVSLSAGNVYVFRVEKKASKNAIAKAVEDMFSVNVLNVNTIIVPGKKRRIKSSKRWAYSKSTSWKKAMVEIKEGQKIDLFPEGSSK